MKDHNNTAPVEVVIGALVASVLIFGFGGDIMRSFIKWLAL